MLTLEELNCQDFELFRKCLNNLVFGNSMVGALWDYKPFLSIEHLMLKLSGILHSLPNSGKYLIKFKENFIFLDIFLTRQPHYPKFVVVVLLLY